MKLYYAPNTRAVRPRWILEEAGAPYELVRLDLSKGEQKSPEHLARHPHGAVPVLVDGDLTMIESSAICMYLADKFADRRLAPPPGSADRGRYYQWMVYGIATMEAPILQASAAKRKNEAEALAAARAKFADIGKFLEREIGSREFLVGDHFTAADVMVAGLLRWGAGSGLLEGFPQLQDYTKRLTDRPAFAKARS
jgi:glutathione S-transferase